MNETHDIETTRAIIKEGLRRGYDRKVIADKLNLSLAEIARLEADDLREDADLASLTRMVELAEAQLAKAQPGWVLTKKLSATMNLAVLGRALGADGVIEFVSGYFRVTGCLDLTAASLNLPSRFVHECCLHEIRMHKLLH